MAIAAALSSRRTHGLPLFAAFALTIGVVGLPSPALAVGPALTVTPLEWNVVGLDSNSPASGPHRFHIGAKVCNTGAVAADDVSATWTWDTAAAAVSLDGPSTWSLGTLAPSDCAVAYFGVTVVVANTSYDKARRFHISASATGAATVSTPTPREIYVEKLISQNRNSVTGSTGATNVFVGDTVTYTFSGQTASNYEQLTAMPYFDPSIFKILSVTKTVQTGGASTQFYSDACGWDDDPTSADYRTCSGTGKTGGTFTVTITVKVVGAGTTKVSSVVDDFSGSSYHYNADYSDSIYARTVVATEPPPPNQAPVAVDDSVTLDQDASANVVVLGNDSDPDGDTLSVTGVTQPGHGTAVVNEDGTVTYTPTAGYSGPDSFTYTISDGHGGTATATVSVTVKPVVVVPPNRAPVAVDDSVTLDQDTSANVVVLTNDSDPDGDALSVTSVTDPAHGGVLLGGDGTVTYTPTAGYSGPDSFTYTISDGHGGTATATVSVTVKPVVVVPPNRAPVAVDDSVTLDQDTSANVVVLGNDSDPDEDALSVTSVTDPAHGGVLLGGDGTVTYTPTAGYSGPDSFTYTISDGHGGTATATVNVTVNPVIVARVNGGPVAVDDEATVDQDSAVDIEVLANDSDPDEDPLSVTSVTEPGHGVVDLGEGGTVTYRPASGYSGPDSFDYSITDGHGGTATATVRVTVAPAVVTAKPPAEVAPEEAGKGSLHPTHLQTKVAPAEILPNTGMSLWGGLAGELGLMIALIGAWIAVRSRSVGGRV